jgi:hypothetical protein
MKRNVNGDPVKKDNEEIKQKNLIQKIEEIIDIKYIEGKKLKVNDIKNEL